MNNKKKKAFVVVGSENPVKIRAVERVFKKIFVQSEVRGVKVDSGVSCQPMSFEQSYKGALNRAEKAFKRFKQADYSLGIEAGIENYSFGYFTAGVVVVIDKKRRVGKGISCQLFLPIKIINQLKKNKELGRVLEVMTGRNIKHQEGAFGLFTDKLITREDVYTQAVVSALGRFLKPDLYE